MTQLPRRWRGIGGVESPFERVSQWAERRRHRVGGHNPWRLAVAVVRSAGRHRLSGHAAEMSFFASLTLVPSTITVGAVLHLLGRVTGADTITRAQNAAVDTIRTLIGPRLGDEVIVPFVRQQLTQPQGGVAIGGLIATWWLSSHLFTATSHALDVAYEVADRRPTLVQRFVALCFALGSVAVVALTLGVMVIGPVLDAKGSLPSRLHLGPTLALTWNIIRWPLVLLTVIAFLMSLYRFSPSVRYRWRDCLPGALLGTVLWIAAAVLFRAYLAVGAGAPTGVAADDANVLVIGRAVGAVIATVVWAYFSSIAILLGGELNARLVESGALAERP